MTTLYLDGDLLAHRIAASLEERYVECLLPSGAMKIFKHVTAMKEWLGENDYSVDDVTFEHKADVASHWEKPAQEILDWKLKGLNYWVKPSHVELVLGIGQSFRVDACKLSHYKGKRANAHRPSLLSDVRLWLTTKFTTHFATDGLEGDDLLVELAIKNKGVIASADKDFYAQPVKVVNIDSPHRPIDCDCFGDVRVTKTDAKGKGQMFFCAQLLLGDNADEFFPFRRTKLKGRFGQVRVVPLLMACNTKQELIDLVVSKFKEAYEGGIHFVDHNGEEWVFTWEDALHEMLTCVYMRRHKNDKITVKRFIEGDW